jgi:two-component system OmpR family response regulator
MKKATILSVDDDQDLQAVVRQYLESENYTVVTAANGQELMEKFNPRLVDIILLDLVLPDSDGITLISKVREKTTAPIIVVSGKSDTMEKVVCLEMGADDYMTKPFEMRELAARIKVSLRRVALEQNNGTEEPQSGAQRVKFDKWILDRTQYQLFNSKNKSANLTTGEFKLLEALVLSPNRALSREQLFELTRNGEFDAYDRAIDIQIGRIRKKLGEEPDDDSLIKTVRGVGYMFTGKTEAA